MTRSLRSRRSGWWVLAVIALALIVGSVAASIVLRSRQDSGTPSQAASEPTPTTSALASDGTTGANGCLAGPGISAGQLEEIRAQKNYTPLGAVEFIGAFVQFYTAGDPSYRTGIEQATAQMTSGDAKAAFSSITSSSAPDPGNTHSTDLAQGYYNVVSATQTGVTVDIVAQQIRNGVPIAGTDGSFYGGSRYTVQPTNDGWVVTSVGVPGETAQHLVSTGQRFIGGC